MNTISALQFAYSPTAYSTVILKKKEKDFIRALEATDNSSASSWHFPILNK